MKKSSYPPFASTGNLRPLLCLALLSALVSGCEQPVLVNDVLGSTESKIIEIPSQSIPRALIGASNGFETGLMLGQFAIFNDDYILSEYNFASVKPDQVELGTHQVINRFNGGDADYTVYQPDGLGNFFLIYKDPEVLPSAMRLRKLLPNGNFDAQVNYLFTSSDTNFNANIRVRFSDRSVQCKGLPCGDYLYLVGNFDRIKPVDSLGQFLPDSSDILAPFPVVRIRKSDGRLEALPQPALSHCNSDGVSGCSTIFDWQRGQMPTSPAGFASSIPSHASLSTLRRNFDDARMDFWSFEIPVGRRLRVDSLVGPNRPFVFYDAILNQFADVDVTFEENTPVFLYDEIRPGDADDNGVIDDGETVVVPIYADSWAGLSWSDVNSRFTVGKPSSTATRYFDNHPAYMVRSQGALPKQVRFSMRVDGVTTVTNQILASNSGSSSFDNCFNASGTNSCFVIDPARKFVVLRAQRKFSFSSASFVATGSDSLNSHEIFPVRYRGSLEANKLIRFQKELSMDSKIYALSFQTCPIPSLIANPTNSVPPCSDLSTPVDTQLFDLNDLSTDLDNTGFQIDGEFLWLWGLKGTSEDYAMVLQKYNLMDNSLMFEKAFSVPRINIISGQISMDRIHLEVRREISDNGLVIIDVTTGSNLENRFDLGGGKITKIQALGSEEIIVEGNFLTVDGLSSPRFFIFNPKTNGIRRNPHASVSNTVFKWYYELEDSFNGGTYDTGWITQNTYGSASPFIHVVNNKIYLSGAFDNFNGTPVHGAVRLNSDLTIDSTFRFEPSNFSPVPYVGPSSDPYFLGSGYGHGSPFINFLSMGSNSPFMFSQYNQLLDENGQAQNFLGLINSVTGERIPVSTGFNSDFDLVDNRFRVAEDEYSLSFFDILNNQILPFSLSSYSFSPTNQRPVGRDMASYKNYLIFASHTRIGSDTKKLVAIKISTSSVSLEKDLSSFVPAIKPNNRSMCISGSYWSSCQRIWIRNLNDTHLAIATDDDQEVYTFEELGLDN